VRVAVRDQGPGLTAADLEKLFQKFQRLSAKPTGGESSTGLGLSIAELLVRKHGGRIWAESEPGCGSTFFVELPGA
jgi:signal transduction histidine kinase